MPPASSLRDRRLRTGLTQGELAARAGVSRQLVAAVEAGRHAPAVDAALRLAGALGTTVEQLFAPAGCEVVSALGDRLPERLPLRVGRVGDQLVAAELADHGVVGAGWARADGAWQGDRLALFEGAQPAGFVLAGCDPAFGLAERLLEAAGASSLLALSAPTGTALDALKRGSVHAAVVHGVEAELPPPPIAVARWHVARWQVGVAVAAGRRWGSLEAVLGGAMPVAQRDPAAASQQAFERARLSARLDSPPAGPVAAGHLDAARLAATLNGAGVTTEAAARAFGLRFFALEDHVVELWVDERWLALGGLQALVELLRSSAFSTRLSHFGGYDLTDCGELRE